MKNERLARTLALLGEESLARLASSHVLLVGLGGVGGHAFDALVRTGVGSLTLCDFDRISESNINRQILADLTTVGRLKTEVAADRACLLSPDVNVTLHSEKLTPEGVPALLDEKRVDFVIDAIDDVAAKVALAHGASERGIPLLSCLGMGNRLDPTALRFTDLADTSGCPLARAVRTRLRRLGVEHVRVLISDEPPLLSRDSEVRVGSVAYVPAVAGLMLAAEAVRILTASPAIANGNAR